MTTEKNKNLIRYYVALFVLCCCGFAAVSFVVFVSGRGFILKGDGIAQDLNWLIFIRQCIRDSIASFFAGKGFSGINYIFNLGYGADGYLFASSYLRDPLCWISALWPMRYMEHLYYALIVIRVFLCAATFSVYCFSRGKTFGPVMVASLCYAFSGFAVFKGMYLHPLFLDAAYLLPLIAWAADRVFSGKGTIAFPVITAFSFLQSFYFSYISYLVVIAYCAIAYFAGDRTKSITDFVKLLLKFIGLGLVGLAIAGLSIVPYLLSLASLDRLEVTLIVPLLFDPSYYIECMSSMVGGVSTEYDARYVGIVAVFFAVVFLCNRRSFDRTEWRTWSIGLLLATAAMLIPFFGHLLNGLSYVTDRWMYAASFCMSYIVCLSVPVLGKIGKKGRVKTATASLTVALLTFAPMATSSNRIPVVIMGVFSAVLFIYIGVCSKRLGQQAMSILLIFVVIANAGLASFLFCSANPIGWNRQTNFIDKAGSAVSLYQANSPFHVVDSLDSEERTNWRYSMPWIPTFYQMNESLNQDRSGLTMYDSFYNRAIADYRNELGLSDSSFVNHYAGSDSRLALDAFAGAKYYVVSKSQQWMIPATYEDTGLEANGYKLYKTDYSLPFVFSFDSVVSKRDYDELNMVQKQEAQLQGCIINMDEDLQLDSITPHCESKELIVECSCDDGIVCEDGTITVNDSKAKIHLKFDQENDAETYVCFSNLRYVVSDDNRLNRFQVTISTPSGSRSFSGRTPYDKQYSGKHNWAVNLGSRADLSKGITISFNATGTYSFDSIEVVSQPLEPIKSQLSAISSRSSSDVEMSNNSITVKTSAQSMQELVFVTFAYSSGWTASVDGKPATVYRANTGFMAVKVENPGEHVIVFTYETPGLRLGVTVSCCGLLLFIALIATAFLLRRRKRKGAA